MRSPACLRRTAVLLTAIACLLGQGAGLAHLVLVRHATCVEHDALVHTGDRNAPATPAAAARGTSVSGVPAEASHDDDHCLVVGCRRRDLADPGAQTISAADLGFADPSPLAWRQSPPPSPVPLLLLAPKSSPPILTV